MPIIPSCHNEIILNLVKARCAIRLTDVTAAGLFFCLLIAHGESLEANPLCYKPAIERPVEKGKTWAGRAARWYPSCRLKGASYGLLTTGKNIAPPRILVLTGAPTALAPSPEVTP